MQTNDIITTMQTRDITKCALFAALLCISAMIAIPITPIPFTMQVLMMFLTGGILGKKNGVIAVVIYLLLGFIGLPVFSGMKGGPQVLFGATGGYIIGFIPMTLFIGYFIEKLTLKPKNLFIIYFLGLIIVYIFGTVQLMFMTKMDLMAALMAAVIPFILLDIVKIIIAVPITIFAKKQLRV